MQNVENTNESEEKKQERQRGAVIVEATISLTTFMFAMFTLLFLIQIAYVQSRMSVALGCATKELAEYLHVYYVTEMDEMLPSSGGKSSELFNKVGELVQSVGGELGSISNELGQFVNTAGASMSGDSLAQWIKSDVGNCVVEQMMKKNLQADGYASGDDFMARNGISDLDFSQSSFLEGDSKDIFMQVTYDIQVIKLLNIDYKFHMSSWAYTTAWGN